MDYRKREDKKTWPQHDTTQDPTRTSGGMKAERDHYSWMDLSRLSTSYTWDMTIPVIFIIISHRDQRHMC